MDDGGNVFSNVWRTKELSYSGVIAQTIALSSGFRVRLLQEIRAIFERRHHAEQPKIAWEELVATGDSEAAKPVVKTEKQLADTERIDVHVEFSNRLLLAIENKTFAALHDEQLKRYADRLSKGKAPWILLLLAPSSFKLSEADKPQHPDNFVQVSYKDVQRWVEQYLNNIGGDFEKNYFCALRDFLGELEMKPLTMEEIGALVVYGRAQKKLRAILSSLDVSPESSGGQYLLGRTEINGLPIYLGFRFGTDWYYDDALLNGKPEVIVYIKDEEPDSSRGQLLSQRLKGLERHAEWTSELPGATVKFYERKSHNECRFAVRQNLDSFAEASAEAITDWFNRVLALLRKLTVLGEAP